MTDSLAAPTATDDFIRRWEASGAAERANYALFLTELCDLLSVPRPEPTRPDDSENAYVLERSVTFHNPDGSSSVGRIDLYKRGCFVLEVKQGSERPAAGGCCPFRGGPGGRPPSAALADPEGGRPGLSASIGAIGAGGGSIEAAPS